MDDDDRPSIISATYIQDKADSAAAYVRKDDRFITERISGSTLDSGDTLEILDSKEKGVLHSIKIVTDNAYAAVSLQLDDERNKEPVGETPAELLINDRTTRSDREFFAIDNGPGAGYSMMYFPTTPQEYHSRIVLKISNRIRRNGHVYGFNPTYLSRGGLPTPASCGFLGGGSFTHPSLGDASLATMANAMALPVGTNAYVADNMHNLSVYNDSSLILGTDHPYEGLAGKPVFSEDTLAATTHRVVFGNVGTAIDVASVSDEPTINASTNYPGSESAPTQQHIVIYSDVTENGSDGTTDASVLTPGARLFIRAGDTIYFPGVIDELKREDGAGAFAAYDALTGPTAQAGAYIMQVQPGLRITPDKLTLANDSGVTSIGTLTSQADTNPQVRIKEVIVKRHKLVSYDG